MTVSPKVALVALCAAAFALTASPGQAQKKRAPRPKSKIVVTTSRVERSLAGVRLGTKWSTLFRMFGQPTEVLVGAGAGAAGDQTGAFGAGAENPFGGGGFPSPGGVQTLGPSSGPSGMPMPGGPPMAGGPPMPGGPGMPLPMPGGPSMPGGQFPGQDMGTGDTGATQPSMTYIYSNFRKHKGLEMTIQMDEDGRVIQIIGTSLKSVPGVVTSRGVGFSSTYMAVLGRYSWPESQTTNGNFMQASFQEHAHVAFQFLGKKVVRIVIAEVD